MRGPRFLKCFAGLIAVLAVAGGTAVGGQAGDSPRSATLRVTKNCLHYTGVAGSSCTITSSNINAVKPGSKAVYDAAADFTLGALDSDLVIGGPGNNAYGHVVLDLLTSTGTVTLSGGTGVFTHLHAGPIAVACPALPDCSWDGPYSFSPND